MNAYKILQKKINPNSGVGVYPQDIFYKRAFLLTSVFSYRLSDKYKEYPLCTLWQ